MLHLPQLRLFQITRLRELYGGRHTSPLPTSTPTTISTTTIIPITPYHSQMTTTATSTPPPTTTLTRIYPLPITLSRPPPLMEARPQAAWCFLYEIGAARLSLDLFGINRRQQQLGIPTRTTPT